LGFEKSIEIVLVIVPAHIKKSLRFGFSKQIDFDFDFNFVLKNQS
jgi:hypothetical protein